MKRRHTLKLLASISVGAFALGHWSVGSAAVKSVMTKSVFNSREQNLITSIADTIIPKGQLAYGAVDLGVPIYMLGYFQACETGAVQDNIKKQLVALQESANKKFKRGYSSCTQSQREVLLQAFNASTNGFEKSFFDIMKKQTMRGFRTSKEVMTNEYHYRVAPGLYKGSADINANFLT